MMPVRHAVDFKTVEGLRLRAYFEERIAALRMENDAPATPEKTAETRGRIAELKTLLTGPPEQTRVPRYSGQDLPSLG